MTFPDLLPMMQPLQSGRYFVKPCYRSTFMFLSCLSYLQATDYSFLNDEAFVRQSEIWHFESDFSKIAPAKMTTSGVKGSKLRYSEGNGSMYFSHFLNNENALAWQAGVNYTDIDWKDNPRFTGSSYLYGITSLSWISYSVERWRWVINGGVSFDTKTWNFGKSGVYFTTLWGRYEQKDNLGLHLGFFAYYGALNGYVLPILGFDWYPSPSWEIKGVFPIDASVNYKFAKYFTTSLLATSMGGPYRFPRRAHGGIDSFDNAIFKIYSTAVEWDIKFTQKDLISIGIGAGWDFGGWIQIASENGMHKKYYDFDGAAYGRAFLALTF